MSRSAPVSFACIGIAVITVVVVSFWPRPIEQHVDADDQIAEIVDYERQQLELAQAMATDQAVLEPTQTATATKRPTNTRVPTYGNQQDGGVYVVPQWTSTIPPAQTSAAEILPPCVTITPNPYGNFICYAGTPGTIST